MLRMQLEYLCYIDQDPPKPTTPKTTIRLSRTARAMAPSPSRQGTPGAPVVSWDWNACEGARHASVAFLEKTCSETRPLVWRVNFASASLRKVNRILRA